MVPLIAAALPLLGKVLDRVIPDKAAKEKALQEIEASLIEASNRVNLGQIEINKIEAGHKSLFVAGWRPFVGWTCGIAMLYHFLLQPIIIFGLSAAGLSFDLPAFDMGSLMTVLMGMLGLGGLRTFEKTKGVTK